MRGRERRERSERRERRERVFICKGELSPQNI